jgi:hypothetical protein
VAIGREYVESYVEFVHYVERLHLDISVMAVHYEEPKEPAMKKSMTSKLKSRIP